MGPNTNAREIAILLRNNQRQHRTLHVQKDVLPFALSPTRKTARAGLRTATRSRCENCVRESNYRLMPCLCTDQFLIATTKINGPICDAHCVDPHPLSPKPGRERESSLLTTYWSESTLSS